MDTLTPVEDVPWHSHMFSANEVWPSLNEMSATTPELAQADNSDLFGDDEYYQGLLQARLASEQASATLERLLKHQSHPFEADSEANLAPATPHGRLPGRSAVLEQLQSARHSSQPYHINYHPDPITSMWDGFCVDAYFAADEEVLENIQTGYYVEVDAAAVQQQQQRTAPKPVKPFLVASKPTHRVTKGMIEYQQDKERRRVLDEYECTKRPVPTQLPASTYDEESAHKLKEQAQRHEAFRSRRMLLRERQRQHTQQQQHEQQRKLRELSQVPDFKARPAPTKMLRSDRYAQLKEKDFYRKIRIQIQAEEKLKQAKAPGAMEERLWVQQHAAQHKERGMAGVQVQAPPQHTYKRKSQVTVPQPFNLTATKSKDAIIAEARQKHSQDSASPPTSTIRPLGHRATAVSAIATGLQQPPARETRASQLRAKVVQAKLAQQRDQAEQAEYDAAKEEGRRKALQQRLQPKLERPQPELVEQAAMVRIKRKQLQMAEDERAQRYKDHLAFMDFRLDQRPLLFERRPSDPLRPAYSMHAPTIPVQDTLPHPVASEEELVAALDDSLNLSEASQAKASRDDGTHIPVEMTPDSLDDAASVGNLEVTDLADETFDTWSVSTPATPSVASEYIRAYQAQQAMGQDGVTTEQWQPRVTLEVSQLESEPRRTVPLPLETTDM
eukprot:m.172241 g.172241  ORF g.172241 m.172241 type:complete len:671 (+) comp16715_c0_seq1:2533-4545(+)